MPIWGAEKMNADFRIETLRWTAEVSLYGGQLLRASCKDSSHPVIWLGSRAQSGDGQAIRGGVPICWPWFGASPVPGRPAQGFARLCRWELEQLGPDFVRMRLPGEQISPELRDFPFELPDPCLAGITINHLPERCVRCGDLFLRQTVLLDLLGEQMMPGDRQLFFIRISADLDQLHPVKQRSRYLFRIVGGQQEEHLG